jgi:hypothetical protein
MATAVGAAVAGAKAVVADLERIREARISLTESGRDPSLRSGFRQQAPASLTPAKRLNFEDSHACSQTCRHGFCFSQINADDVDS